MNHGCEPWTVRVLGASGACVGAGMLLGTDHVLTCAHVVSAAIAQPPDQAHATPQNDILLDLVNRPDLSPLTARVVRGGWVPPADDEGGDIALLHLHQPVPEGMGAPLRRLSRSWGRVVHAFGFPEGLDTGEHVTAELAGWTGPGREWVQMNCVPPGAADTGRVQRTGDERAAIVGTPPGIKSTRPRSGGRSGARRPPPK